MRWKNFSFLAAFAYLKSSCLINTEFLFRGKGLTPRLLFNIYRPVFIVKSYIRQDRLKYNLEKNQREKSY